MRPAIATGGGRTPGFFPGRQMQPAEGRHRLVPGGAGSCHAICGRNGARKKKPFAAADVWGLNDEGKPGNLSRMGRPRQRCILRSTRPQADRRAGWEPPEYARPVPVRSEMLEGQQATTRDARNRPKNWRLDRSAFSFSREKSGAAALNLRRRNRRLSNEERVGAERHSGESTVFGDQVTCNSVPIRNSTLRCLVVSVTTELRSPPARQLLLCTASLSCGTWQRVRTLGCDVCYRVSRRRTRGRGWRSCSSSGRGFLRRRVLAIGY